MMLLGIGLTGLMVFGEMAAGALMSSDRLVRIVGTVAPLLAWGSLIYAGWGAWLVFARENTEREVSVEDRYRHTFQWALMVFLGVAGVMIFVSAGQWWGDRDAGTASVGHILGATVALLGAMVAFAVCMRVARIGRRIPDVHLVRRVRDLGWFSVVVLVGISLVAVASLIGDLGGGWTPLFPSGQRVLNVAGGLLLLLLMVLLGSSLFTLTRARRDLARILRESAQ